jgi:hypothetical protein
MELSGGRGAPGAMQRKRITWRGVPRQRTIPANDLGRAAEVQPGRSQRRHMQRLADMASRIRPTGMLVKERAACREIEQRKASQQRKRASYNRSLEFGSLRIHQSTLYLSTLDEPSTQLVAIYVQKVTRETRSALLHCQRANFLTISSRLSRYRSTPRRRRPEANPCCDSGPAHGT